MENTLSVSFRLIFSASVLTVLSACGGGGGSSSNNTPPPAANTPPVLASIGAQTVAETETLNFPVTATDADATTPDLTASGLPTGATFNPANGTFNWVPAVSDAAGSPYQVTFTAADEIDPALTVAETVEITVTAVPVTADCTVDVTSPIEGDLQAAGTPGVQDASATLVVDATLSCVPEIPVGVAVKLAVVGASNGSTGEEIVTSAPFSNTFTGLSKDEYTVTATVVDSANAAVSGANTSKEVAVGIGDYYIAIGDSITVGFGDDINTDDVSLDGRNVGGSTSGDPDTGGGYTPILNDLLTADLGYPHTVIAIAVQGTTSEEGVADTPAALASHENAQRVLVKYGMNDAGPPFASSVPSGLGIAQGDPALADTFKGNMQAIINLINNAGMEPVLAKINIALADDASSTPYPNPDTGARSVNIKEYNQVIDELLDENSNITVAAPDFYAYFLNNTPGEYFDAIHPNGTGYQSMADIWLQVLTQ